MRWSTALVTLLALLHSEQVLICAAQSHHHSRLHKAHITREIVAPRDETGDRATARHPQAFKAGELESSLEPIDQTYKAGPWDKYDFLVFHNVVLRNDSLLYFIPDDSAIRYEELPDHVRLSRGEAQINVPVIEVNENNRWNFTETCRTEDLQKPALLFSGPPWDHNLYEFFANTMMPAFQGAVMSGLLDLGRMEALSKMNWTGFPDREPFMEALYDPAVASTFTLIAGRPSAFGAPWSYFFEHWTTDMQSLRKQTGACFSTLVVVEDAVLRFLVSRMRLTDPGYFEYRRQWMQTFQQHAMHSEHVRHRSVLERNMPLAPHDYGSQTKRPRVVIATRPTDRRQVLNEDEIITYLRDNWDVHVMVEGFRDGLGAAFSLMQDTDVIIGVHGAGLMNTMFKKPGGVLIQLLPYGFTLNEQTHQLIRGDFFADMIESLNGTYLQWQNHDPQNAFIVKSFWDYNRRHWNPKWGPQIGEWQEHPDASLTLPKDHDPAPFWIYQNTRVNMVELAPILDEAMAKMKPRQWMKHKRCLPPQLETTCGSCFGGSVNVQGGH
ncbi:hypothetical protein WJX73_005275 [Symbiochloris irregularis]|uniref:Glycosyltransferase 61 catalytic domain-containing protein n=1 Tax=Symbiochloris irregularis TaxID=706552 RepID=A0AAW1P6Y5_9CHLO